MPIDYSKWDNLDEYSDSDNEQQNEEASNNDVRVTRLDGPSKVTFGGGGEPTIQPSDTANASASKESLKSENTEPTKEGITPVTTTKANKPKPKPKTAKNSKTSKNNNSWQEKGGMVSVVSPSGKQRRLYWSQDRYSVVLRMELFGEAERVEMVEVEGAVPFTDRNCAVGTTKPTLLVFSGEGSTLLLEEDLPHAVHYAEEDEGEIEWNIERSSENERFLTVSLYKAVPAQDLAIWWRRPVMSVDEVGDSSLPEISGDSGRSESFRQAWDEAHKNFQERREEGKRSITEIG